MLNHEVISEFLGEPVILGHDDQLASATPRVSGSLPSHYAPTTPTVLVPSAKLRDFVEAQSKNKKLGVLARKSISAEKINPKSVRWITLPKDPEGYAQNIYKEMRELDALNYDMIVIEAVPENSSWLAINDRLQRGSRSKL